MIKLINVVFYVLLCCIPSFAQSAFSVNASPVTLPGNKSTLVGTEAGLMYQLSPNITLRESNIVASSPNGYQMYTAGFNYYLPIKSLNGSRYQFYYTANFGIGRVTTPDGVRNHSAIDTGIGLNYAMGNAGMWNFAGEIKYAKLPGYANNTWIVEIGPTIHF